MPAVRMQASAERALQQSDATVDHRRLRATSAEMEASHAPPRPPPPPPPPPASAPPFAVAFKVRDAHAVPVRTAQQLQDQVAGGARDIEIRSHLDLRTLSMLANPASNGRGGEQHSQRRALLYADAPLRTIRVCPRPASSAAMAPLKPCLSLVQIAFMLQHDPVVLTENRLAARPAVRPPGHPLPPESDQLPRCRGGAVQL